MKKVLIGIIAIIMVLGLVGCSSTPAEETNTSEPTETAPVETESQTPEPTPTEIPSSWEVDYYIDDFGDETEDGYVRGEFQGTFDNTAGKGHDLTVYIYYDPSSYDPGVGFRLVEYGRTLATYYSSDLMSLNMKIGDERYTTELFGTPPNGDLFFFSTLEGRSLLEESYYIMSDTRENVWSAFINALNAGEEISCYIIIGDGQDQLNNVTSGVGGTKYSFKIDGNGFAEQVALLGK